MNGMARPDGFQRGGQVEQAEKPDELAELMTMWEGGILFNRSQQT